MELGSFVKVLSTSKACPGAFGEVVNILAPKIYLVGLTNGNQFIVHERKLQAVGASEG